MKIKGKKVDKQIVELIINEIIDYSGNSTVLLSNILRYWSPNKLHQFIASLGGHHCEL